jgi:hypothetical protein
MPMLIFLKALFHLPRAVPTLPGVVIAVAIMGAIILYSQLVYELFEKHTQGVREWLTSHVMVHQGP